MKKWIRVEVEETLEEKYKKMQRRVKILVLVILLMALSFVIYELKFAEKSIFDKGDKYEEYDPNYVTESNNNIEQKSTIESVVSNVTSNIIDNSNANDNNNDLYTSNKLTTTSNATNNITSNVTSNVNNNSNTVSNKTTTSNDNGTSVLTSSTSNPKYVISKPVITDFDATTTDYTITVNYSSIKCTYKGGSCNSLKLEYSIDGTNWQSSAVFSNLTRGKKYTVYVKYTDTDSNQFVTYSKQFTTTATAVPSDISGRYSLSTTEYIVHQLSTNKIVYEIASGGKVISSWQLATLSGSTSYTKKYKNGNAVLSFDYKYLDTGANKYTKSTLSTNVTTKSVFSDLYSTTGNFLASSSLCNGRFKHKINNTYITLVGYTNPSGGDPICNLYIENGNGNKWHPAKLDTKYNYLYDIDGTYEGDVTSNTVYLGLNVGKDLQLESGTHNLVRKLDINDAIELKITGKIS